MEALFERVLAHVPTSELHESYNAVLHEEFTSVAQSLDGVVAAFAKLEEVHDAVTKLQQRHESSTGGRNDRLKMAPEKTMKLQRQLQRRLDALGVGMKMAQLERKRKRVEEEVATVSRATGDEGASCHIAAKKAVRLKADVGSVSHSGRAVPEERKRSKEQPKSEKGVVAKQALTEASRSKPSSSSDAESDDGEGESNEDSDEVEGSEAAWKALMRKGNLGVPSTAVESEPVPDAEAQKTEAHSSAITQLLKKSVTYWKTIVEEVDKLSPMPRSFIIPEVLAALKESVEADVDGSQQSEVACTLKVLVAWGTKKRQYEAQYSGMYREYADAVEEYADRLASSAQKDELKRLNGALFTLIENLDGVVMSNTAKATREASFREAKRTDAVSLVIGRPVNGETRIGRLLRLLVAFKRETATDPNDTLENRMIKVVGTMSRWLSEDLHKPLFLALYRVVVNTMLKFSIRIRKVSKRDRVVGLLNNMLEAIADSPNSKERLAKIHNRVAQLFEEVKQYQGKPILGRDSKKLMDAIGILRNDVTIGWDPYRDATMRSCVKKFKDILQAQNTTDVKTLMTFKARLETIANWQTNDPVE